MFIYKTGRCNLKTWYAVEVKHVLLTGKAVGNNHSLWEKVWPTSRQKPSHEQKMGNNGTLNTEQDTTNMDKEHVKQYVSSIYIQQGWKWYKQHRILYTNDAFFEIRTNQFAIPVVRSKYSSLYFNNVNGD